jgi:5'-deoxynucleotidase
MEGNFFAMMQRMRYINRWGLMRNTQPENIQEHSLEVAMVAHALAVIRRLRFADGRLDIDPDRVASFAIYHDATEILTGDLPTPVKYHNAEIRAAYRKVEELATDTLLGMLPDDMKPVYRDLLRPDPSDPVCLEIEKLVKAADRIAAYIKCVEEEKAGNGEFREAQVQIRSSIQDIQLPEVAWFMEMFLPAYALTLDQLK